MAGAADPTPQFLNVSGEDLHRLLSRARYDVMAMSGNDFINDEASVSGGDDDGVAVVMSEDDDDDASVWDEECDEALEQGRHLHRQKDNASPSPPPPKKKKVKRRIRIESSSDDDDSGDDEFVEEQSEAEKDSDDSDDDDSMPDEAPPPPPPPKKKKAPATKKTEAEKQAQASQKLNDLTQLRPIDGPPPVDLSPGDAVRIALLVRRGSGKNNTHLHMLTGVVQTVPAAWFSTSDVVRAMAAGSGMDVLGKTMLVTFGVKSNPDNPQTVGNDVIRLCLPGEVAKRVNELQPPGADNIRQSTSGSVVLPFEQVVATVENNVPCFLWLSPDTVIKSHTGKIERAKMIRDMKAALMDGHPWPSKVVSTSAVFKNTQPADRATLVDVLKTLLDVDRGVRVGIKNVNKDKAVVRPPDIDEAYVRRLFAETPKAPKRAAAPEKRKRDADDDDDAPPPPKKAKKAPPPQQRQLDEFTKPPAPTKEPKPRKRAADDDAAAPPPEKKHKTAAEAVPIGAAVPVPVETTPRRYVFTEFDAVNCSATATPVGDGTVSPLDISALYSALRARAIPVHSLTSDGKTWTLNAKAPPAGDAVVDNVAVPKFLQLLADLS
jgi:hypothetical protein